MAKDVSPMDIKVALDKLEVPGKFSIINESDGDFGNSNI